MEIDMVSLITGIVFFVIIFGIFGFLIWSGKRRVNKTKTTLDAVANFHQLTRSAEEVWNDKGLGLDKIASKLVFVDCSDKDPRSGMIHLLGCLSVQKEFKEKEFIRITLEFANRREVLTLFDVRKDDPMEFGFHQLLTDKWVQLIREAIPSKKTRKAA